MPATLRPNRFEKHPILTLVIFILLVLFILDWILGTFWVPKIPGIPDPYFHHGMKRYYKNTIEWGGKQYYMITNSLSFKDKFRRKIPKTGEKYRIVFLGDSFTEGVGLPYELTFVGKIDEALSPQGVEVLNASVRSFSPKLYYLKTQYLLDQEKLKFNELIVWVDISDIQDEIIYDSFQPYSQFSPTYLARISESYVAQHFFFYHFFIRDNQFFRNSLYKIGAFFTRSASTPSRKSPDEINVDHMMADQMQNQKNMQVQDFWRQFWPQRDQWIYDENIYQEWGKRGVELATKNMDLLVQLCRRYSIPITLVVYPWPNEIEKKNLDSKHVQIWNDFCSQRHIPFINLYPDFITDVDFKTFYDTYFIPGDVHWNEKGHQFTAEAFMQKYKPLFFQTKNTSDERKLPEK